VDGEERRQLLNKAQVFALPSHQENFGISVGEALAHAVPVVISDRVNLAADVAAAEAGWITGVDAIGIRDSLRLAMCDKPERTRRGALGRQLIREHFSWHQAARDLIQLYNRSIRPPELTPEPF